MQRIRLGRTGALVPAVSLGTWGHGGIRRLGQHDVGWSGHDDSQARAALVEGYRQGITHWDTADVYGDGQSEGLIGTVWDEVPRDEIFLASKVGWDPGPYRRFYHPEQIRRQLARSLELLRTDHIDLYYLHHCDFGPDDRYLDEALAKLHRARDEGKIRFIGLSDWNAGRIMAVIDRVDPDVVQPYRNLLDDDYATSGLEAWAAAHDTGVAFFSPLKHGLLLGRYDEPADFPPGDHRRRIPAFQDAGLLAHLRECRHQVEEHFPDHPQPVLHALVDTLLTATPNACALLGMRTPDHVVAAATLGEELSGENATWVKELYGAL